MSSRTNKRMDGEEASRAAINGLINQLSANKLITNYFDNKLITSVKQVIFHWCPFACLDGSLHRIDPINFWCG